MLRESLSGGCSTTVTCFLLPDDAWPCLWPRSLAYRSPTQTEWCSLSEPSPPLASRQADLDTRRLAVATVIDIRPVLAARRLRETNQIERALRVSRTVCAYLGIAANRNRYKRFITKTPSANHRDAVLYWILIHQPDALDSMNLSVIRRISESIDRQVRDVIPTEIFWSHE